MLNVNWNKSHPLSSAPKEALF